MVARDENGRFLKGHTGNPKGRAKRKKEEKYLKKMFARCTLKKWQGIVDKALEDSEKGDAKARQWLSDYLLGKPAQELKVQSTGDLNIILMWDDEDTSAETP